MATCHTPPCGLPTHASSENRKTIPPHGTNRRIPRCDGSTHRRAHPRALSRIVPMSRNTLAIVIAILVVGTAILGYMVYQDQQTSGVEIKIGEGGLSIEEK